MDFTLSEYINALLDKRYAAETKEMYRQLYDMSNSREVRDALEALDSHVEGLVGNTLTMNDPELSDALAIIQREMNVAQGLVVNVAPNLAVSGGEVAIQSVMAKLFGGITDEMIRNNLNPLEQSAFRRFMELASQMNINISSPDAAKLASKFLDNPEWIARMNGWGDGYSTLISDRIRQGMNEGWSPIKTAREIRRYATELPKYAAENITRTVQLESYREASAEMERLNGKYIERKIRIAALDMRTCPACIALHGTEVPMGQPVEDHYNGRCDAIYVPPGGELPEFMQSMSTPGNRNFVPFQNGEDWFKGLSEQQQRQILGAGKFEIYKSGTPLSEFWHMHEDSIFGDMPGVKPLWMMQGYGSYAEKVASGVGVISDFNIPFMPDYSKPERRLYRVDIRSGMGQKAGGVQFRVIDGELNINDIFVDSEFRGQGLASSAVIEIMRKTNTSVLSETVLTNQGQALYKSLERKGIKIRWYEQYVRK